VDDLSISPFADDVNGYRTRRGIPAVTGSRLLRYSSLLLVIALGFGCRSNEQAAPDMQAVAGVEPAGPGRGDDTGHAEWPSTNLAEFVFTRLDLTTFRNSTGGQREPGQRFFTDFGVRPTEIAATVAKHGGEEWLYSVHVLGRRDFNRDGVEEVAVCFVDKAQNGGTYNTSKPLLLQLVGRRAVALDYEIDTEPEAESCSATH